MRYFKLLKTYQLPKGVVDEQSVVSEADLNKDAKGNPIVGKFMRPCTKSGSLIVEPTVDADDKKEEPEQPDNADKDDGVGTADNISKDALTVEALVSKAQELMASEEKDPAWFTKTGMVKKSVLEERFETEIAQELFLAYTRAMKD